MADDAPWVDPVVVPDDISELQPDIEAYRREQRRAHPGFLRRLTYTGIWRQWSALAGVIAGALALCAVIFVVLTVGDTGGTHLAPSAPIAVAPAAPVGAVGGLLPDVTVRAETGDPVALRQLRPAVLALIPMHCDCAGVVATLAGQAAEVDMPLVVVAPAATDAEVASMPGRTHLGQVSAVFDDAHVLADTYVASGITVVVVAPDATAAYVERDVTGTVRLEQHLFTAPTRPPAGGRR